MRKLIAEVQVSVDGCIADANGGTGWMIWNWGPEWTWDKDMQKYHTALTASVDCILLSRQMAEEGFIAHWAKTAENPGSPQYEFAKHITQTHKVVFSTTLTRSTAIPGGWDNAEIAEGSFIKAIQALKKQKGKDMMVYGGASFVSSLIRARLVDEFHLIVNPVIIGKGLSIFNAVREHQQLRLKQATAFSSGVAVLHYTLE